jgi:hypothetical protein
MEKLRMEVLDFLCSTLQIVGFVTILTKWPQAIASIVIGISGFAAIVKFFLPYNKNGFDGLLRPAAAIAGIGIIIFACTM